MLTQLNMETRVRRSAALMLFSSGLLLSSLQSGQAADTIGTSVRIKNTVNASVGNRTLAVRDPVFDQEQIRAHTNSHGELLLQDNSKIIVGENSSITLDDFVTGGQGFKSGAIKVVKGAFRFISGNSKKGFMEVSTPLSTIGVRGTIFDVYVNAAGITSVILFSGAVEVCSSSNCITTNKACDIVQVDASSARQLPFLRSNSRALENRDFYLTTRQSRFPRGWRAPVRKCSVRALLDRNIRRPEKPHSDGDDGHNRGNNNGGGYSSTL